jgi:hypothetical protein
VPGLRARRVAWDRAGRFAVTLAGDGRLVGVSAQEEVWSVAAVEAAGLSWPAASPRLVVVGAKVLADDTGRVRLHPGGADLALSSSGAHLAAHVGGAVVEVYEPSGTLVGARAATSTAWRPGHEEVACVDGDEVRRFGPGIDRGIVLDDQESGPLLAAWSPGGEALLVHGAYGSFRIVDPEGAVLAAFPAHERDPNLAAAIGSTVLVTAGADRRLCVYDLVRGGLHCAAETPDLVMAAALSADERFVVLRSPAGEVSVRSTEDGSMVGRTRRASYARWHPDVPVLACCDGDALWLEVY